MFWWKCTEARWALQNRFYDSVVKRFVPCWYRLARNQAQHLFCSVRRLNCCRVVVALTPSNGSATVQTKSELTSVTVLLTFQVITPTTHWTTSKRGVIVLFWPLCCSHVSGAEASCQNRIGSTAQLRKCLQHISGTFLSYKLMRVAAHTLHAATTSSSIVRCLARNVRTGQFSRCGAGKCKIICPIRSVHHYLANDFGFKGVATGVVWKQNSIRGD